MREKLWSWLLRYGPAEVLGTLTAVLGYYAALSVSDSIVLAAYAGAIGENCGFYGVILLRERIADRRLGVGWSRTLRNLVLEFGAAEALDSLIVRPLMMGVGGHWAQGIGVVAGKLCADVCFYLPAIVMYEWRLLREARASRRPLTKGR